MWNRFSIPRSVRTSMPCPSCGERLDARRTCREAYLRCEKCRKDFTVQSQLSNMDQTLEDFLEALNCDRV